MKKLLLALALVAGLTMSGCEDQKTNVVNAKLNLSSSRVSFDSKTFANSITVTSDYPWEAVIPSNATDWLTLDPTNGPAGTTTVEITVTPTTVDRRASIRLISGSTSKTFVVSQVAPYVKAAVPEVTFEFSGETLYIGITTDQPEWSADIAPVTAGADASWCNVAKDGTDCVAVTAQPQPKDGAERIAILRLTAGEGISSDVTLRQSKFMTSYVDREVVRLQSATRGDGVNLVLMGDGYTAADMVVKTGKYEVDLRAAAENFFSVYPYSAYRDRFNVWMVGAVSNEAGLSTKSPAKTIDTKFKSLWEGGRSTGIMCDADIAMDYAELVSTQIGRNLSDLTVIMPINSDVYAGTCLMYSDGFSVAMCPVNPEWYQRLIAHEAGGHGFAKLADEYINFRGQTIPKDEKEGVMTWKNFGLMANVDFSADIAQTSWAAFADNPTKYPMVSTFQGAAYYTYGVWRPEYNSCMNDNTLYYNAPSRWAMVRRIKSLSGEDPDYTAAEFMAEEVVPSYPSGTRASDEPFIPLGRPILIDR